MSRTRKDQPWWVRAEWWEPEHWCQDYGRSRWYRCRPHCDLPAEPIVNYLDTAKYQGPRQRRSCCWVPVWPPRTDGGYYYQVAPPKWFVNHVSIAPTRRRVRDDCRRAIQEYRATGDVDIIPPIDQHRHCATWLWM